MGVYSKTKDGVYCKYWVIFSLHHGGVESIPLKYLVKIHFSKWNDAVENWIIESWNNCVS